MKPEFDGMTAEEMLDATDALVGVVWYLVVVLLITVSAYPEGSEVFNVPVVDGWGL